MCGIISNVCDKFNVGLDLSLNSTGLCVTYNGELIRHEVIKSSNSKHLYERVKSNAEIIKNILSEIGEVKLKVFVEGLSYGSVSSSTRTLAINHGVVLVNSIHNFVEYIEVAPTTIKKLVTGSGRADKQMMFAALPEDVQSVFSTCYRNKSNGLYDVTDAYWLSRYEDLI